MKIYIDEAGRGPLAGPVTVGAVIPWKRFVTKNFSDSKGLSEKRRNSSYIKATALQEKGKVFFGIGWSSNKDIDKLGIMQSLQNACCEGIFKAIKNLYSNLGITPSNKNLFRKRKITPQILEELLGNIQSLFEIKQIVIDGNHDFGLGKFLTTPIKTIIKGDSKVSYIGFASIVAKVERDKFMCGLGKEYAKYGFAQHKGYGTLKHRKAIKKYGRSDIHRVSFCKNIV